MIFNVINDATEPIMQAIKAKESKVGHIVAEQVRKDTSPYVPFLTGSLDQRTRVVGNAVIYPAPYARYLYYGKVMVDSATGKGAMHYFDKGGNEVFRFPAGATLIPTERDLVFTKDFHPMAQSHWFEASKAQNLDKWLRVAQKAVNKYGE